jgi:hypothetical protein
MTDTPAQIKFRPGNISITHGAAFVIGEEFHELVELLRRHLAGDWGEVDKDDAKANEAALTHGERILSSYTVRGEKLWVITERDRSATTVLTPGEY